MLLLILQSMEGSPYGNLKKIELKLAARKKGKKNSLHERRPNNALYGF